MFTSGSRLWPKFPLVLGLMLSFLATSCTAEKKVPPPSPPPPPFAGTLTLYAAPGLPGYPVAGQPDGLWFEERAQLFESLHPEVKVSVKLFADSAAMEAALRGSDRPDLFFGRFLPELSQRLADLQPLLSQDERQQMLPGSLDAYRREGKLLGLPALAEVQVLALNRRAFEQSGVALPDGGAWSRDDFEVALARLSRNGRHAMGFYNIPGEQQWYSLAGPIFQSDGSPDQHAAASLERIQVYRAKGWVHPDTGKLSASNTWSLFAADDPSFAMMPVGAWAIPLLREAPYNAPISVAGLPDGVATGRVFGSFLFNADDPRRLGAALDLARVLSAPDQQLRIARATGLMPADRRAGNPFEGDGEMSAAYQVSKGVWPAPTGAVWDRAEAELSAILRVALVGGRTPEATLTELTRTFSLASTPASR